MNNISIIIIALGMITTNVSAADAPMQCNLTCKTEYGTPQTAADAQSAGTAEPATAAVTGIPLSAEADSDTVTTGGFDFVTECVQYQGKVWAWREGKCKSMAPDWKSPGLGNFIKY